MNDTGNWLLLRTWVSADSLTVALYGTPQHRISSGDDLYAETGAPPVKKVPDPTLFVGQEFVESNGSPSLSTSASRKVYDAKGKLLYDDTWYSSYRALPKIVHVGTKPKPKPKPKPQARGDACAADDRERAADDHRDNHDHDHDHHHDDDDAGSRRALEGRGNWAAVGGATGLGLSVRASGEPDVLIRRRVWGVIRPGAISRQASNLNSRLARSPRSQAGKRAGRKVLASTTACAVEPSATVSPSHSSTYSKPKRAPLMSPQRAWIRRRSSKRTGAR